MSLGEGLPDNAGHITAGKGAGPVIDRVWRKQPQSGVPVPTRTMPSPYGGYPRPTRPGVGALATGPGAFLALAGAVVVFTVGAIHLRRKATVAPARLRGGARQITDKAALEKSLKTFRRGFSKMETSRGSDVDEAFLKLRKRLDEISRDSSGFFPEANDMTDQALRDLIAARDAAREGARAALEDERRRATIEDRESRRRARPWEISGAPLYGARRVRTAAGDVAYVDDRAPQDIKPGDIIRLVGDSLQVQAVDDLGARVQIRARSWRDAGGFVTRKYLKTTTLPVEVAPET